jgi:hypothetical protein
LWRRGSAVRQSPLQSRPMTAHAKSDGTQSNATTIQLRCRFGVRGSGNRISITTYIKNFAM